MKLPRIVYLPCVYPLADEPADKRCNIYTNILQPMGSKSDGRCSKENDPAEAHDGTAERVRQDSEEGSVQAEVHYR